MATDEARPLKKARRTPDANDMGGEVQSGHDRAVGHSPGELPNISQVLNGSSAPLERMLQWLRDEHDCDVDSFLVEVRESADGQRRMFAKSNIKAFARLLEIPSAALLNQKTLKKHCKSPICDRLSSLQLVTYHVARWRQGREQSKWAPFLETLPEDFVTIPLRHRHSLEWKELLSKSPHSLQKAVDDVERRFERDWSAVRKEDGHIEEETYIWAWLNFNSRCVSYPLGHPSDANQNATFAPLIDMANHAHDQTPQPLITWPQQSMTFLSCAPTAAKADGEIIWKAGEEVLFTYGRHDNATLVAEYGFALAENPFDAISVDSHVWALFAGRQLADRRSLLELHGYDGDFTVELAKPIVPSWRLIVALALLVCHETSVWEAMVSGAQDDDFEVDPAVEAAFQELLILVRNEAEQRLEELRQLPSADEAHGYVRTLIIQMWERTVELLV